MKSVICKTYLNRRLWYGVHRPAIADQYPAQVFQVISEFTAAFRCFECPKLLCNGRCGIQTSEESGLQLPLSSLHLRWCTKGTDFATSSGKAKWFVFTISLHICRTSSSVTENARLLTLVGITRKAPFKILFPLLRTERQKAAHQSMNLGLLHRSHHRNRKGPCPAPNDNFCISQTLGWTKPDTWHPLSCNSILH